jgi:hypothetical protein
MAIGIARMLVHSLPSFGAPSPLICLIMMNAKKRRLWPSFLFCTEQYLRRHRPPDLSFNLNSKEYNMAAKKRKAKKATKKKAAKKKK